MNIDDARLAPLPGAGGLACRFPGIVLFCAARTPEEAVADLIGRCRQASAAPAPGTPLARQLAGLLATSEPSAIPPFAVAARTADGIAVLLHGNVDVEVTGDGADQLLSAATSVTWVDRLLVGELTALVVRPTEAKVEEGSADVDLIEGVVAASGLRLESRGEGLVPFDAASVVALAVAPSELGPASGAVAPLTAAQPPAADALAARSSAEGAWLPGLEPIKSDPPTTDLPADPTFGEFEPPPDPSPSGEDVAPVPDDVQFESVLLHEDHADHDHEDTGRSRPPLPVEPDPAEIRSAESQAGEVIVQGVLCSRRHFNDPRSRFCSSCGISMVHQTSNPTPGPRPPLGVIVFEDGTTYSLSANYVLGRQPDLDPRVARGDALPMVIEDSGRTVSRAHAELRLVDWEVHFVHLSKTNGSFVWEARSEQWLPVTDQPVVLAPGTRIALGRRTAVFESALVR